MIRLTNKKGGTMKESNLRCGVVQMDGFDKALNCLYDPSNKYWNGFANPYLEKTDFDKWVAWLKKEESDSYEDVKGFPSEEIWGKLYYYCGGAFTWSYTSKMNVINKLTDIYNEWGNENNLQPLGSADEELLGRKDLTNEQRKWLKDFCETWEQAESVQNFLDDNDYKAIK
jgi:hypothetical protein